MHGRCYFPLGVAIECVAILFSLNSKGPEWGQVVQMQTQIPKYAHHSDFRRGINVFDKHELNIYLESQRSACPSINRKSSWYFVH